MKLPLLKQRLQPRFAGTSALASPLYNKNPAHRRKKMTLKRKIYLLVIIFGLMQIFFPFIARADLFGFEVQDVYSEITSNVKETNDILADSFDFTQTSPYEIIELLTGASRNRAVNIINANKTVALVVATLLIMVDFLRKSISFEWSSKWENVLLFLVKIIVVKQLIQNSDVIISQIYSIFNYINTRAIGGNMQFLPYGNLQTYEWTDQDGIITGIMKKGWWDFWTDVGAGQRHETYTYIISQDSVRMFYPNATFNGTNLNNNPLANPTTALNYMPTLQLVFFQAYFLVMKAIAYIVFVIAVGRVFELAFYTMFAPLPMATLASDVTNDVAKGFIKTYIASVLQVAVIATMFIIYTALNQHLTATYNGHKLIQLVGLIALGLSVVKSGAWAKRLCGTS